MIYLVTGQKELFNSDKYKYLSVEESLQLLDSCEVLQYDSETSCKNAHLGKILCIQFGNKEKDFQIVVDTSTINVLKYKDILESKNLIGHNLKFDLQWLYNYNIIPRRVYDTMIVEQLLYLGFPYLPISPEEYDKYEHTFPYKIIVEGKNYGKYELSYSLKSVAYKYLGIDIDKSIRGEIIWRGLDEDVVLYAAGDVVYLEDILEKQWQDCIKKQCTKAAILENKFVPSIAYLEWCGIKLDENKWKEKMVMDKANLDKSLQDLNNYALNHPKLQKWVKQDLQGDLFSGFDTEPKWTVDWQEKEAIKVVKALGFNVTAVSKQTQEESESIMEKVLTPQKGIDDTFLKLYFDYQGYYKVCSSFGQGHLDAINPKTNRIHTNYKQLGAASGRMSCGGGLDEDLSNYKGLPKKSCKMLNMQQLPHDELTRSCFISDKNNLFVSCDYSAQEGRVQGDIYQDEAILKMYREGIDGHSMYAKIFFKDELKDIDVHDIKKLRPDLRTKAKGPEFALAYGGGYTTIMSSLGCSEEEALTIVKNYEEGFAGTIAFAKKGSKFVKANGYILMCPSTGHKMYWWDHKKWLERQQSFTQEFWEDYRENHKGTGDEIAEMVRVHFKASSKYDRLARNAPAQGTSSIMTKSAVIDIFNWIVDNGYFSKILCCALVHDETNWEYPKEVGEFPNIVKQYMENSASIYCKSLPIPAELAIGEHWIH